MGIRASRVAVELDLDLFGLHKSVTTHKQPSPEFCGLLRRISRNRLSITAQPVRLKVIIVGRPKYGASR